MYLLFLFLFLVVRDDPGGSLRLTGGLPYSVRANPEQREIKTEKANK
jgi:hypothetical protein